MPTIQWNKTYHAKGRITQDDNAWFIEPKGKLYQWVDKFSVLLVCSETLFIINEIIADESLHKQRKSVLKFCVDVGTIIYGCLQSYLIILKNLRRQAKTMFVWYPKEIPVLKMMHDESNLLTYDELCIVTGFLKNSKHVCLCFQNVHPFGFKVLNHA